MKNYEGRKSADDIAHQSGVSNSTIARALKKINKVLLH
jgi:DNA-binding MurR/RpiR family transcriptional regulator